MIVSRARRPRRWRRCVGLVNGAADRADRAVAVRHHARHAVDLPRPRPMSSPGAGQAPTGPQVDTFYALTDGKLFGLPVQLIYLLVLARRHGGGAAPHALGPLRLSCSAATRRRRELTGVPRRPRQDLASTCSARSAPGFAGILLAGWLGSAPANLATGYELQDHRGFRHRRRQPRGRRRRPGRRHDRLRR